MSFSRRRHCPTVFWQHRYGLERLLASIFLPVPQAGLCKINKIPGFCFRTNRLNINNVITSPARPVKNLRATFPDLR